MVTAEKGCSSGHVPGCPEVYELHGISFFRRCLDKHIVWLGGSEHKSVHMLQMYIVYTCTVLINQGVSVVVEDVYMLCANFEFGQS